MLYTLNWYNIIHQLLLNKREREGESDRGRKKERKERKRREGGRQGGRELFLQRAPLQYFAEGEKEACFAFAKLPSKGCGREGKHGHSEERHKTGRLPGVAGQSLNQSRHHSCKLHPRLLAEWPPAGPPVLDLLGCGSTGMLGKHRTPPRDGVRRGGRAG